jgi:hypothetical protein
MCTLRVAVFVCLFCCLCYALTPTSQMDLMLEDLRQQNDREKLVFRAEADR